MLELGEKCLEYRHDNDPEVLVVIARGMPLDANHGNASLSKSVKQNDELAEGTTDSRQLADGEGVSGSKRLHWSVELASTMNLAIWRRCLWAR